LKGIVRESGNIRKCFDEFYEDFVISDELRKVSTNLAFGLQVENSDPSTCEKVFWHSAPLAMGPQGIKICQMATTLTNEC